MTKLLLLFNLLSSPSPPPPQDQVKKNGGKYRITHTKNCVCCGFLTLQIFGQFSRSDGEKRSFCSLSLFTSWANFCSGRPRCTQDTQTNLHMMCEVFKWLRSQPQTSRKKKNPSSLPFAPFFSLSPSIISCKQSWRGLRKAQRPRIVDTTKKSS